MIFKLKIQVHLKIARNKEVYNIKPGKVIDNVRGLSEVTLLFMPTDRTSCMPLGF